MINRSKYRCLRSIRKVIFRISRYFRPNLKPQCIYTLGPPSNIFFQLLLISWMVTLSSCLIWQIISFIRPPNEYGCVYASLSGPAIDLQKMPFLLKKNSLLRWSSFWSWRVCKQAKLLHLGHRKPARIHWKADAPKARILVRILVQKHNWVIFLRK